MQMLWLSPTDYVTGDLPNAKSGLCFPSYEKVAEAAGCARSTVAEAIKAPEDAGVPLLVQRIKGVRVRCPDLFGADGVRVVELLAVRRRRLQRKRRGAAVSRLSRSRSSPALPDTARLNGGFVVFWASFSE